MKVNIETAIVGRKAILVPYREEHVARYNEWMQSEELRLLTASEPLSIEEEYEMQSQYTHDTPPTAPKLKSGKWQEDPDKLTFIILAAGEESRTPGVIKFDPEALKELQMVGDVNLFLHGELKELQQELRPDDDGDDNVYAELEIMIAEPTFRRKGIGREAVELMLSYTSGRSFFKEAELQSPLQISPSRLLTRVSNTNASSISLFQSMGFKVTKHVEVFGEVEMRFSS